MNFTQYINAYHNYFWQWEEEGEVIGIPHSNTIAYRDYVQEALEYLSPQGLPPFGSLLLAIIATNPNATDSLNTIYSIISSQNKATDNGLLTKAISFLKMLSEIPKEYKSGSKRLQLFQVLFFNMHNNISSKKANEIVAEFSKRKQEGHQPLVAIDYKPSFHHRDFRIFELLESKLQNVDSIIDRIAALPEIPKEVLKIEEKGNEGLSNKDLLEELIQENKTFYVGSLVKHLWSGLNIPFHNSHPSEQPIGGVSDLANKGDLSRLLVSEFAHDNLVFLSRFVNNESLYFNREIPPQNNNLERVILIDVSIKSWGTPRTIAFAIMVAIAKHPKTDIHCSAFAIGNSFRPISFETIDGIIDGLQFLDSTMDSKVGLDEFFKTYGDHKNMEVFYISSVDTLQLPSVHKLLSNYQASINYLIKVDAEGNIDLYKKQQNSRKHVQHILLPLNELWKKDPKQNKPTSQPAKSLLYPLLFPYTPYPKAVLSTENGDVYMVTHAKHLFRLHPNDEKQGDKGWELINEDLPFATDEFEMGTLKNGDTVLLMFNRQKRELVFLNVGTGEKKFHLFSDWRSSGFNNFVCYQGQFIYQYIGFPSKYWVFDLEHEVDVVVYENIPKNITEAYSARKLELEKLLKNQKNRAGILKNVHRVFLNQKGNLVFNVHELSIDHNNTIKLKQTGFIEKKHIAQLTGRDEFTFSNGSTVTIHKSGMLILRNNSNPNTYKLYQEQAHTRLHTSAPSSKSANYHLVKNVPGTTEINSEMKADMETDFDFSMYVPSSLATSLGIATDDDFAGNPYYLPNHLVEREPISPLDFWQQYMVRFVNNIIENGI